jgi:hypothetical protein
MSEESKRLVLKLTQKCTKEALPNVLAIILVFTKFLDLSRGFGENEFVIYVMLVQKDLKRALKRMILKLLIKKNTND